MSDLLDFAVIGAGRFAKHYINILQDTYGMNLLAVCARTKEGVSKVKEHVQEDVLVTTSIPEAVKKADCVVIATPPSTHFEIARKALFLKKHVLLEKPMTSNLSQAKKLSAIVKKSKSVFMVGHQFVYNDYIRHLKKEIKSLGKVDFAYAEHLYPGPMRDDIGCLWDAGTHPLSVIQYLLDPGDIKSANGSSFDLLGNKLDDYTSCALKFKSLRASITVSWMSPLRTREIILFGKNKTAVFNDVAENKLKLYDVIPKEVRNRSLYTDSFGMPGMNIDTFKPQIPGIKANNALLNQLEHFKHCIMKKKEPLTGIKSSLQITKWLDFASRKIKVPGY